MKGKFIVCHIIAVLLLTACASNDQSAGQKEEHENHTETVMGDIREETSSIKVIPEFLQGKPEDMKLVYMAAAQNKELLEQIPCYCGCGDSVHHKNSYNCFVHENKEDGTVVWDDHGTKCGVCLDIAAQSVVDYQNGKTIKEIRAKIDDTYKEGYAEPTPTPEI
ncbi:PCYCGC motif-containing (lipo)protein [Niallia oryzisoli]|uniref:PCYCGC motif-containing (lipo)protein n=1 Tax=Niallia oryzisoli TaxID=1737571 RepID=UPI003735D5AB